MTDSSIQLHHGDCLDLMTSIPDGSIDMILCDLPYGVTNCAWDSVIPFEPLWKQYKRIIKPNGAIVLTAIQPFTSALVMSNPTWFRYEWIWDKVNLFTNHLNADRMPMRQHENVCVFYDNQPTYNKQPRKGKPYSGRGTGNIEVYDVERLDIGNRSGIACPGSVLEILGVASGNRGLHPTQKPVALLSYLIRTYTNEGETVLDNCMGSGSTGVACVKNGRNFIGMEKDETYFCGAQARICRESAQQVFLIGEN